jgi:hypothetical protein
MSWLITPSYDGFTDDADATAYLAAVQAADGQVLEPAVRLAVNTFVKGCKADGIWNAIKASCILAGARTLNGALVPLVGTAPTNFNFVSGDYNRKTGLVGDGSTKYLNSNRNNNADPQDSNHNAIWVSEKPSAVGGLISAFGSSQAGVNSIFWGTDANGLWTRNRSSSLRIWQSSASPFSGLLGVSRSSSSGYQRRLNGATAFQADTSQPPFSATINIFARMDIEVSNARLAFYSIGESLNLALLDARVTDLINAFGAAIP